MYQAPIVACVGAGQLARMLAESAQKLGIVLRVLANSVQDSAALVLPENQVVLGDLHDPKALDTLLEGADALTFEHELIPEVVFERAAAAQVPAHPAKDSLRFVKDRVLLRHKFQELGLPVLSWVDGSDIEGVTDLGKRCGWPLVAKVSHPDGEGHSVELVANAFDYRNWYSRQDEHSSCMVEQRVPFTRELAVTAARCPNGEMRVWPVAQTFQEEGKCVAVLAPAAHLNVKVSEQIQRIARQVGQSLGITGVFALEFFEQDTREGASQLYLSGLSMRPHNSGHWTQDGSVTSQFEQHLRAVLDLPLGETSSVYPFTAMANILGSELEDPGQARALLMEQYPQAKLHLYGKKNRPGRKLGHVNVGGTDPDLTLNTARQAADLLMGYRSYRREH